MKIAKHYLLLIIGALFVLITGSYQKTNNEMCCTLTYNSFVTHIGTNIRRICFGDKVDIDMNS